MSSDKSSNKNLQKDVSSTWTAEQLDVLIMAVRGYEVLYDQSNANYSNREIIDQIWHRVAGQLDKTAKECSKKWQLLRAGYRKRRHLFDAPSGSGAKKVKKWAFYDSLTFLEPHLAERETVSSIHPELKPTQYYIANSEGFLQPIHSDEETEVENNTLDIEVKKNGNEIVALTASHYDILDDEAGSEVETQGTPQTPIVRTPTVRRQGPAKGTKKEDVDREFANYLKNVSAKKQETQKKTSMELFLLSCVDEANTLSVSAQRLFKIRVVELISELSNN